MYFLINLDLDSDVHFNGKFSEYLFICEPLYS